MVKPAHLQHIADTLIDQMQAADAAKALVSLDGYVPNTAKTAKDIWPVIRPALLFIAKSSGSGTELRYGLMEYITLVEKEAADAEEAAADEADAAGKKVNATKKGGK
jgi:soluble cytochrome b562